MAGALVRVAVVAFLRESAPSWPTVVGCRLQGKLVRRGPHRRRLTNCGCVLSYPSKVWVGLYPGRNICASVNQTLLLRLFPLASTCMSGHPPTSTRGRSCRYSFQYCCFLKCAGDSHRTPTRPSCSILIPPRRGLTCYTRKTVVNRNGFLCPVVGPLPFPRLTPDPIRYDLRKAERRCGKKRRAVVRPGGRRRQGRASRLQPRDAQVRGAGREGGGRRSPGVRGLGGR